MRIEFLRIGLVLVAISIEGQSHVAKSSSVTAQWVGEEGISQPIVRMKNTYSYQPSAWETADHKTWNIWFCGGGAFESAGDTIFYTTASTESKAAVEPTAILVPSKSNIAEDGQHACAPSVIRYSQKDIEQGREQYILYYECAPRMYDRAYDGRHVEAFSQICAAFSSNGTTWRRYNGELWNRTHKFGDADTTPTPVIKAAPEVLADCAYAFIGGRHTIDTSKPFCTANNFINNYGVGHPSAIVMKSESSRIWFYYYDSKGDWSQHGVYLAKSWDGLHFEPAVKTDLPNAAHVKYYAGAFGAWDHVFVATTVIGGKNGFLISEDGIHWTPSNGSMVDIGNTENAHCAVPGAGDIIGDDGNNISSLSVNILVSEGYLGKSDQGQKLGCYNVTEDSSRGSTWRIQLLRGRIVAPDKNPLTRR